MEQVFNPSDRQTSTWVKLRKHFEERLAVLRSRNDSGKLDERATAILRGQIAMVKYILSLDTERPMFPDEEELFRD